MKNISIKGIVIAFVIAIILDFISGVIAIPIFAGALTEEALATIQYQTNFLIYALTVSALTSVLGGYISAQYGKLAPYKNSALFGFLGVATSALLASYDPLWFDIIGFITTVPAALFGGYISVKKNA